MWQGLKAAAQAPSAREREHRFCQRGVKAVLGDGRPPIHLGILEHNGCEFGCECKFSPSIPGANKWLMAADRVTVRRLSSGKREGSRRVRKSEEDRRCMVLSTSVAARQAPRLAERLCMTLMNQTR